MHRCNEEEDEETYFALRIIHVFVHVCGHPRIEFARNMGEVCNFEHVIYERMGHRERSKRSQEQIYIFVNCLLLGSWMEKEFRKQTRVKHITFKLLCERLGPYSYMF